MQQVLVIIGISGSGKSTFATQFCRENPSYLRINRDEIRKSILPMSLNEYWKQDNEYKQKIEAIVQNLHENAILTALQKKWNLVIDNTHLKLSYLNEIIKTVGKYAVEIRFKYIDTPIEVCIARDMQRKDVVGEEFIRKQAEKLGILRKQFDFNQIIIPKNSKEQVSISEPISYDENLPKCVLVDIDGTVADKGRRIAFDWLRVGEDTPKKNVIRLVKSLKQVGYQIIFFSGRDSICRPQTIAWLCRHFDWQITDFQLFMRAEKDSRKDSIVKKELFYQHIANKYFVDFVVDDRDQVVEMWRKELYLTCLQVDYGNF
jgi:predicted kinase